MPMPMPGTRSDRAPGGALEDVCTTQLPFRWLVRKIYKLQDTTSAEEEEEAVAEGGEGEGSH